MWSAFIYLKVNPGEKNNLEIMKENFVYKSTQQWKKDLWLNAIWK